MASKAKRPTNARKKGGSAAAVTALPVIIGSFSSGNGQA